MPRTGRPWKQKVGSLLPRAKKISILNRCVCKEGHRWPRERGGVWQLRAAGFHARIIHSSVLKATILCTLNEQILRHTNSKTDLSLNKTQFRYTLRLIEFAGRFNWNSAGIQTKTLTVLSLHWPLLETTKAGPFGPAVLFLPVKGWGWTDPLWGPSHPSFLQKKKKKTDLWNNCADKMCLTVLWTLQKLSLPFLWFSRSYQRLRWVAKIIS